jgi:hypothetical protein
MRNRNELGLSFRNNYVSRADWPLSACAEAIAGLLLNRYPETHRCMLGEQRIEIPDELRRTTHQSNVSQTGKGHQVQNSISVAR